MTSRFGSSLHLDLLRQRTPLSHDGQEFAPASSFFDMKLLPTRSKEEFASIYTKPKGLQRVTQLFRVLKNCPIPRFVIATIVAKRRDPLKLVRAARIALRSEGILILGHDAEDRQIAGAIGLPEIPKGGFYSMHPTWRSVGSNN
jgi:hypothetical protein